MTEAKYDLAHMSLRQLMKKYKIKTTGLAKWMGVSTYTAASWRAGRKKPCCHLMEGKLKRYIKRRVEKAS